MATFVIPLTAGSDKKITALWPDSGEKLDCQFAAKVYFGALSGPSDFSLKQQGVRLSKQNKMFIT
jgi:hypothetical protein